jgi:hypothetical protein
MGFAYLRLASVVAASPRRVTTSGCLPSVQANGSCETVRPQFAREYRRELFMDGPVDARSRTIKNHGQKFTLRLLKRLGRTGNVTLLCHCAEGETQCHRHELVKVIRRLKE